MRSQRRLAGLEFEVQAPPPGDSLPRMDIPVFVGFTASGPLNIPVAVEDIAGFHDLFGEDLALARDDRGDRVVYACLPSSVRAFFRNGGRRCWVIRVSRPVQANRFELVGLVDTGGRPAWAWARSHGSWSDSLRVTSALVARTIALESLSISPLRVVLAPASAADVTPGDLIRITVPGTGSLLWLVVEDVERAGAQSPPRSSELAGVSVTVVPGFTRWVHPASPLAGPLASARGPFAERLTFDLSVRDTGQHIWHMRDLGFTPRHPRYWAALQADASAFVAPDPRQAEDNERYSALRAEARRPRFPLAADGTRAIWLPLDMDVVPEVESAAESRAGTPLERDGLDRFTSGLFLDRSLDDVLLRDLLNEAEYIQYKAEAARQLTGIHAAVDLEEASIIAAPDAVHRSWFRDYPVSAGSPPQSDPPGRPEWWRFLECNTKQELPLVSKPPGHGFLPCDLAVIAAPVLNAGQPDSEGSFTLTWTPEIGYIDVLEEAADPNFKAATELTAGGAGKFTVLGRPSGVYRFRLYRRRGPNRSNYSNTVAVVVTDAVGWRVGPERAFTDNVLLDVHRAMLRLSAARGDLFALLSVPGHYREEDAIAHASKLRSPSEMTGEAPPLEFQEQLCFSYGALYHPWLLGREENNLDDIRANPPDGAMAGVMAERANTKGAWIAPANHRLRGVVALSPGIGQSYRERFLQAQVNLIRQEPSGFMALSADTLYMDEDYRPINVRRLLILLRRLVLRTGTAWVFEPHSEQFQRLVQRGFESVLERLFVRGAFAGRTSRSAYQVVTDESLNTRARMEQGSFITEIRVAPSLPFSFLTVRLLQTADRTSVTEGR